MNDERKLIQLRAGEVAPRDGVLISPGYLSELYESMGNSGITQRRKDAKEFGD